MIENTKNFIKRAHRDSEQMESMNRRLVFGTALGMMIALLLAGTISANTGLPNAILSRYRITASS